MSKVVNEGVVVTGAILLILGVVLFFIPFLCLVGLPLAIAGFVVLIVGIVAGGSQPTYSYPPPVVFSPAAPGPAANCPRCGQPLEYVPAYQRWYCRAENVYPWG